MTQDDVLFGYRLQLFDLAGRTTVTHACRVFGVHRSTYYRWKREVERQGLKMLRPREPRRPVMPSLLSPITEQRIVAFALGHPGFGPKRIAAQLARPEWGRVVVSPNGVWKALRRHGLSTRQKRLPWSPATAPPTSRRACPSPSRTSRRQDRVRSSGSTASTSAACTAPRGRSGS
jgi:transposase